MPAILPSVVGGLGSGSVLRILKGSGKSAPSGIDAIIGYNGLVMNNRSWIDSIIITSIDGLADPDIRDSRQDNPQEHGETAFDSWYGGRTLVLKGFIRAFTLDKLRDMETALKTAFLSLEEKPLTIQGKTLASSVQIWCKKSASITMTEEQTRDDMFRRDFMLTLRASNPRFFSLEEKVDREEFGVIDNFSSDTFGDGDYKFIEGNAEGVEVKEGHAVFIASGFHVFARVQPEFFQPEPTVQFDYTPRESIGAGVDVGAYVKYLDEDNFIKLNVAQNGAVTLVVNVEGTSNTRALTYSLGSSPIMRELETAYRIKAELRGNFVWFWHGLTSEWKQTAKYELSFDEISALGPTIYSRAYAILHNGSGGPLKWLMDNLAFGSSQLTDEQVMMVVNQGNFESQPVYELIGPISNPEITLAETGETLTFSTGTEIPAEDTWRIDIKEGTISNSAGESKFGKLDPISDWPQLIEGQNHLRLSGEDTAPVISGTSGELPGLVVRHRHTWF